MKPAKLEDFPPAVRARLEAAMGKRLPAVFSETTPPPVPADPYRSKAERYAAERLRCMVLAGDVVSWQHEPLTFILAGAAGGVRGCRYTPDFAYRLRDGSVTIIEVKGGYNRDDAMIKLKVARGVCEWFGFGLQLWTIRRGELVELDVLCKPKSTI